MPAAIYFGGIKGNEYIIRDHLKYSYDESGNISKITENGELYTKYTYDSLNRLVREDNKKRGKTYIYSYDSNGNILCKKQTSFTLREDLESCAFTTVEYGYDGDRLMSYGNETFEYDDIGNPKKYRGLTLKWEKGRQLAKIGDIELKYDANGRRIKRGTVEFIYDDGGNLVKSSDGLEFYYDEAGVSGVKYNATQYLYRKDAQGNIIAILDSNGAVVVKYIYDAWGNHDILDVNGNKIEDVNHIGIKNPFRYRGYYFDTETELYYLQTRYYDPEVGRFISRDSIEYADPETINGINLYAYCGNNPVSNIDPTGNAWWDVLAWIGLGIVIAAAAVLTAGALGAVIGGIAGGIVYGAAIGSIALSAVGTVGGVVGGMIYDAVVGNSFGTSIWTGIKVGFGIGAIAGAIIGGAIGGAASYSVSGLTNASFWTGLGENGAQIAANAASQQGLTTIGQTFGGKVVQGLTNIFGYKATKFLWISLSKTMASKVSMSVVTLFFGGTIGVGSVFSMYELPILVKRGIEIIYKVIGG